MCQKTPPNDTADPSYQREAATPKGLLFFVFDTQVLAARAGNCHEWAVAVRLKAPSFPETHPYHHQ